MGAKRVVGGAQAEAATYLLWVCWLDSSQATPLTRFPHPSGLNHTD